MDATKTLKDVKQSVSDLHINGEGTSAAEKNMPIQAQGDRHMKNAVCGKGGGGKSTLTCLLALQAGVRGHQVVVIDADEPNTGLFHLLGLEQPPLPLMEMVGEKSKPDDALSGEPHSSRWARS